MALDDAIELGQRIVEESLNLAYHGARAEKQGFKITMEQSFDPAAGKIDSPKQRRERDISRGTGTLTMIV